LDVPPCILSNQARMKAMAQEPVPEQNLKWEESLFFNVM
jgi:hypothetical protein